MFVMITFTGDFQATAVRLPIQDLLGQNLQEAPQPTMYAPTTPTFQ